MLNIHVQYIETGKISIPPRRVRRVPVKQLGIKKVVVVRTKGNGGIPHCSGKTVHQH